MNKSIFREKNVESISSPDSLNDYMRVVRPSVWATLISIILLLLCVTYWGFVGKLDSVVSVVVYSEGTKSLVYADEKDALEIQSDSSVTINGCDYKLKSNEYEIHVLSDNENGDILRLLGIPGNSKVYVYELDADISKGLYKGTIVTQSVRPISFVIN